MTYQDINNIVARHFGTTPDLLYSSPKEVDTIARAAAIHICRIVFKASYLKLMKWYCHKQHTTSMHSVVVAQNLFATNKQFRRKFNSALLESKSAYELEFAKKLKKQMYNLNYSLRKKGIVVSSRTRTVSISEADLKELENCQLYKLIHAHKYRIQFSIV
ncbi:MAG: hypothetical protein WCR72_10665 [Bacteroidota bacterium]